MEEITVTTDSLKESIISQCKGILTYNMDSILGAMDYIHEMPDSELNELADDIIKHLKTKSDAKED